jgi:adenosylcobinamide kinase/adenosylcobinamide-phosphate guanylyltransferase
VLFVATAEAGDEEMRQRIEKHRQNRPESWTTLEIPTGVGNEIIDSSADAGVIIIDCITMLVNNVFSRFEFDPDSDIDEEAIEKEVGLQIYQLLDCLNRLNSSFIIVTNEVGMDLVPDNKMGRIYRDLLGKANKLLADKVDEVYLMVAGIPIKIKPYNYY